MHPFPGINPWSSVKGEDMPHIEVSEKGGKILNIILIVLVVALIASLVYWVGFFLPEFCGWGT